MHNFNGKCKFYCIVFCFVLCAPHTPTTIIKAEQTVTSPNGSPRNTTPAATETTVVILEKTVVFDTGKYVLAKFKSKNAITEDATPKYKIEAVYKGLAKWMTRFKGAVLFSTSEIKRKTKSPVNIIA